MTEFVTHDVKRFIVEKPEGFSFKPGQATEIAINKEGLKEGDALIAAFAEFEKVDYLVSENRHIYRNLDISEFIPVNAQEFLQIVCLFRKRVFQQLVFP